MIVRNTTGGANFVKLSNLQKALRFGNNEFYLEEIMVIELVREVKKLGLTFLLFLIMLVAARAIKAGLVLLKPKLIEADVKSVGEVVIGTVKGILHDIGKNLVSVMLEGAGFGIQDLGVDISPDQFVEAVKAGGVDVLALSALLTTMMPSMPTTIETLGKEGLRDSVKVIIGGAHAWCAFPESGFLLGLGECCADGDQ